MTSSHAVLRAVAFGAAAVLAASVADAQEEETFDRTPTDCVSVSSIDRTDVIDDQTILFYMRGRKVYRNYLSRKCPGLEREGRFAYQATGARLCDIDTITVLEQWGGRLNSGFTCPLGLFHPITIEEAELLELEAKEGGRRRDAIDVETVELPEDEGGDAATGEPEETGSDE